MAMLLPLGVLLFMPIRPLLVLNLGQEVRLATEPVDPREIFRGDHVNLKFSIETLPVSLLGPDFPPASADLSLLYEHVGAPCYVTLRRNADGIDEPAKLSFSPPEEGVYIRGTLLYNRSGQMFLDYGPNLKRFYLEENTGLELERAARSGSLIATVKLWRGVPVLVSLEEVKRPQP